MMIWLFVCGAPLLTLIAFLLGRYINAGRGQKLAVDKFLMVQTGVLTALAILIALGGTFLPERSSWIKWTLAGALFAAIFSASGVLYSMITQQAKTEVDQATTPWIPGLTNAAWIALILLAICCILSKLIPIESPKEVGVHNGDIIIVRDRLLLATTEAEALAKWGLPNFKAEAGWAYRTPSGMFVLCFQDSNAPASSITETRKVDENAIKDYCK